MSLQEQLDVYWLSARERRPEIYAIYDRLVAALAASDMVALCRKAGAPMPDLALPSSDGRIVTLFELLERGSLVVSFFRGGWCPYCTLELKALGAALPEIRGLGATLVAITPDTGSALAQPKRDHGLGYEILSDVDQGLALTLGILFRVPEELRELYRTLGIDLGARHGNLRGEWLLPLPATYIVGQDGIIRHAELNPDFKRRMEPDAILARLRELCRSRTLTLSSPFPSR